VAKFLCVIVKRVYTKSANTPDHKAIKLILQFSDVTTLIREKYTDIVDKRLKWDLIIMEVGCITIPFTKRKASFLRNRESDLQRRLEELDKKICNSPNPQTLDSELKEYDRLKYKLDCLYENKGRGAMFLS